MTFHSVSQKSLGFNYLEGIVDDFGVKGGKSVFGIPYNVPSGYVDGKSGEHEPMPMPIIEKTVGENEP